MAGVDAFFISNTMTHIGRAFLVDPLTFFDIHENISSNCCWELFHDDTPRPSHKDLSLLQMLNKVTEAFERGDPERPKVRLNVLHVVLDIVYGHERDFCISTC